MAMCMVTLAIVTLSYNNNNRSITASFLVHLFCFFTLIGFLGAKFLYHTEVTPIRLHVAMASISIVATVKGHC